MIQQPDLATDLCPSTVTVNGAGLLLWGERAKAGEVHIYKMDCDQTRNGIYTLSLMWLQGRTLYTAKEPLFADPSDPETETRTTPLRGDKQRAEAVKQGLMAFK